MSKEQDSSASAKIASFFKDLSTASTDLNSAAKELGKTISILEEDLQDLNLGVSAWHQIAGHADDDTGYCWSRDIGYAQVKNRWGIAIRKTWGNSFNDEYEEEVWRFADAPRWMCIESIGKLPDLFEDLLKRTIETTAKLKTKTKQAKELTEAVRSIAAGIQQGGRRTK